MARIRHENSIDNVSPLAYVQGDGELGAEGTPAAERCERGRKIRQRCNNGAMGRLSWGSLQARAGLALCATPRPFIVIDDLLPAARVPNQPPKSHFYMLLRDRRKGAPGMVMRNSFCPVFETGPRDSSVVIASKIECRGVRLSLHPCSRSLPLRRLHY